MVQEVEHRDALSRVFLQQKFDRFEALNADVWHGIVVGEQPLAALFGLLTGGTGCVLARDDLRLRSFELLRSFATDQSIPGLLSVL